jgi:hemoglobin/transferrin/lactoferrin receptor protein
VASLAYAAPSGLWGWQAVLRASDDARTDRSLAPVYEPPAFAVVDWLAHRQIGRHIEVNAGLRNLFDAKYWEFARVGKVLSTDPQLDFYTEPGRSVQVGVTVRF